MCLNTSCQRERKWWGDAAFMLCLCSFLGTSGWPGCDTGFWTTQTFLVCHVLQQNLRMPLKKPFSGILRASFDGHESAEAARYPLLFPLPPLCCQSSDLLIICGLSLHLAQQYMVSELVQNLSFSPGISFWLLWEMHLQWLFSETDLLFQSSSCIHKFVQLKIRKPTIHIGVFYKDILKANINFSSIYTLADLLVLLCSSFPRPF